MCISRFTNIPTANILVKGSCSIKHKAWYRCWWERYRK
jgi:hypothetical protein